MAVGPAKTQPAIAPRAQADRHFLRARRRGERYNFLASLHSPQVVEDAADRGFFTSIIALATKDYGVSMKSLAALTGASHAAVCRWASGDAAPPEYARPQIIATLADILENMLKAEEEGTPYPDDLLPLSEQNIRFRK